MNKSKKTVVSARFETLFGPPDAALFEKICLVNDAVFGPTDRVFFQKEVDQAQGLFTVLAFENEKLVGYKMGRERKPAHFYSWLGGVLEAARGRGLAREMMKIQHGHLRENGYRKVRTHTKNRWRAMLLLNVKMGFDVIGTFTGEDGTTTIMLEKTLD